MKIKTIIFFIALAIILISLVLLFLGLKQKNNKNSLKINNCQFKIEYALSPQQKRKGLSGRQQLPQNAGMIFVYKKPMVYRFWMKEMKFPLDFVWIKENKVIDLSENIPAPKKSSNIAKVWPKQPVDKVLEINAGMIKKCQIKIGNKVNFNK